ncbi:MAG: hypothetical protein WCF04_11910 [Candidatus Nanopelagicales bacterium]
MEFELTISGGIGDPLIGAYPELAALRRTYTRLVVAGEATTMDVARRLAGVGVTIVGINALGSDGRPDPTVD